MTVMLGIYAMFSLEMIDEGVYLKNLTGDTLAPLGSFLRATTHGSKRTYVTYGNSVCPSVCLLCAGIVPRRIKMGSCDLHNEFAKTLVF